MTSIHLTGLDATEDRPRTAKSHGYVYRMMSIKRLFQLFKEKQNVLAQPIDGVTLRRLGGSSCYGSKRGTESDLYLRPIEIGGKGQADGDGPERPSRAARYRLPRS